MFFQLSTLLIVVLQSLTHVTCTENNIQSNDSSPINQKPSDLGVNKASIFNVIRPISNQKRKGKLLKCRKRNNIGLDIHVLLEIL